MAGPETCARPALLRRNGRGAYSRTVIIDQHRVATLADLTGILGEPGDLVRAKIIGTLDQHCRDFIGRSPFGLLGTVGADGRLDVSPRGGNAGFAEVSEDGG